MGHSGGLHSCCSALAPGSAWRARGAPRACTGHQGRFWAGNSRPLCFYRVLNAQFHTEHVPPPAATPQSPPDLVTALGPPVPHRLREGSLKTTLASHYSPWVLVGVCNTSVDVGNLVEISQTWCSTPRPWKGLSLFLVFPVQPL